MQPSTPPRSRDAVFKTPTKTFENAQPVTPSTTQQHKNVSLLAPPIQFKPQSRGPFLKSPEYTPRRQSNAQVFQDQQDTFVGRKLLFDTKLSLSSPVKVAGPGTPEGQIITEEQTKQLGQPSQQLHDDLDSDDENDLITKKPMANPFLSAEPVDYNKRHQDLLQQNPSLEKTVTYVNKKGEVVSRRNLNASEQKKFKPKRLVFSENGED